MLYVNIFILSVFLIIWIITTFKSYKSEDIKEIEKYKKIFDISYFITIIIITINMIIYYINK